MEYNHYPAHPGFYGDDPNHHPQIHRHPPPPPYPYHYGGYNHPGGKMVFHPIIPHDNDILMGRGGKNNQHSGNEKLRQLARLEAKEYNTSSKKGKSKIAKGLVAKVRQMQPAGRFLKRNPVTSDWEDVGNDYAREKASQVLRDAVALLPESENGGNQNNERKEEEPHDVPDDEPELTSECCEVNKVAPQEPASVPEQPSMAGPKSLKRKKGLVPSNHGFRSSYSSVPQSRQSQPMPPIQGPALKRQRSNNFFERSAFFAIQGKEDSVRSLGTFPGSPCHSRQGSFSGSTAISRVLPIAAASFMPPLHDNRDDADVVVGMPSALQRGSSDEFGYDFY